MKKYLLLFVALCSLSAGTASASVMFDFSGICETDCDRFGLADGTAFNEVNALGFFDGTDTSAGAGLLLSDIEYFTLFGIDFLTGNSLQAPVSFAETNVIGGLILIGGANNFCFDFTGATCAGGRFDTILAGGSGIASSGNGHGPATFTLSTVPVPAAAWLFGSALIGLFGVTRRKSQS